jgi:hypothetical protein
MDGSDDSVRVRSRLCVPSGKYMDPKHGADTCVRACVRVGACVLSACSEAKLHAVCSFASRLQLCFKSCSSLDSGLDIMMRLRPE